MDEALARKGGVVVGAKPSPVKATSSRFADTEILVSHGVSKVSVNGSRCC